MKFKTLLKGFKPLGSMLLIGCIMAGLVTALGSAAEGTGLSRINMPMNDSSSNHYGWINYILPTQVNVEADDLKVSEYADGKEVIALFSLNGSKVALHLLYPCKAPQDLLEPAELRSLLESYDSALIQANYSEELLGISSKPAIWGQIENQIFAAYQPTNQTPAILVMDMMLGQETMADLLSNLSITPNKDTTPLTPGYCPDTTNTAAVPTQAVAQTTEEKATTEVATTETTSASSKDKMVSGMEAAKARLEAMKKNMR